APDLGSLERALRASAAAREGAFDPADLAAALAPLKSDLEAEADRLRRAALATARRGDVGAARAMVERARTALLRELAPDGETPPAPLVRLAEDVADAVKPRFETDLAVEQDDLTADVERRLDALLEDPASDGWSPDEQARRLQEAAGPGVAALEGPRRARYERKRDATAQALAERPAKGFRRRMEEASSLLEAGRFAAARAKLAPWLHGQGDDLVHSASTLARVTADAVDARERAVLERAWSAPEKLARGEPSSLDATERARRVDALRAEVDRVRPAAGESAELGEAAALLEQLLAVAGEAAGLRGTLLAKLGEGPPRESRITLVKRAGGLLTDVDLAGREGPRVAYVKSTDGLRDRVDPEALTAHSTAAALARYGVVASPLALGLLLHWDGDDAGAEAALAAAQGSAPEAPRRRLHLIASAASETLRAGLPTDEERAALRDLLAARRKHDEGDLAGAAQLVQPLLPRMRLRGTAFWRRFGPEVERIVARARQAEERAARLKPFGATPRTFAPKARTVTVRYDFRTGGVIDGATPPPGAVRDGVGLRWPGVARDPSAPPELVKPLRIAVTPDAAAGAASIRVELAISGDEPPPFAALSWGDATFLVFGTLRDFGAFAGAPLHGLERDLLSAKGVDRAVCVYGGPGDARRRLPAEGRPMKPLPAKCDVVLGLDVAPDGSAIGVLGDARFPATGDRPRPSAAPGLELRLPPGVAVKSITLELPAPPPDED
ncbi:MAG TPA: hypothetical protein VEI02_06165, partial [Planctomycetota bacterium]|nr:hypothetical protein [Planctomycetota bacterium]